MDRPVPMIADTAAEWALRLYGDTDLSEAECRALEAWLEGSPDRQAALSDAAAIWSDLGELRGAMAPMTTRARPTHWRAGWQAIAAVLVVALATITLFVVQGRSPDLATDVGGQKVARLEDGSRVTLNTDTRVELNFSADRRELELRRGEAVFEVAHDASRPFVVSVAGRTVTAIGTTFIVRRYPDATGVTLIEGRVRVAAPNGIAATDAGTVLTPGERLILTDRGALRLDRPSIDTLTAWRRGELVFRGTPVGEAVAEMNRYTRKPITLRAGTGNRNVNGIFRTGASADFARVLAALYGWRYDETADAIVLVGAGQG